MIAQGGVLFAANYLMPPGADLGGTATGPPFLDVIYAPNHHADEGLPGGRGFRGSTAPLELQDLWHRLAGLTREDVALIVAFVRSEQEAVGIFEIRH